MQDIIQERVNLVQCIKAKLLLKKREAKKVQKIEVIPEKDK